MQLRSWAIAAASLLTVQAYACINDRDTLAAEQRAMMTGEAGEDRALLSVMAGRFERNPPLYYEMRIDRVRRELTDNPNQPELYDDISAAYDRIGKSGDALVWIERKRELLESQGPMTKENKENWYRYWANAGTFKAHKYIADGAKPEDIGEMEEAAQMIRKAIEIKPDAHFGREAAQLEVMEWFLQKDRRDGVKSLGAYLDLVEERDWAATIEGLAGLIRLGNAWRSVDIHDALGFGLDRVGFTAFSRFASYRVGDLRAEGAEPIGEIRPELKPGAQDNEAQQFRVLRDEAKQWHAAREEFMLAKLEQGMHPDTHNDFWSGYTENDPPKLTEQPRAPGYMQPQQVFYLAGVVGAVALVIVWYIVANVGRRRA